MAEATKKRVLEEARELSLSVVSTHPRAAEGFEWVPGECLEMAQACLARIEADDEPSPFICAILEKGYAYLNTGGAVSHAWVIVVHRDLPEVFIVLNPGFLADYEEWDLPDFKRAEETNAIDPAVTNRLHDAAAFFSEIEEGKGIVFPGVGHFREGSVDLDRV